MTISAFDIYLVSLADKIVKPASFIAVCSLVFIFVLCVMMFVACNAGVEIKKQKSALKVSCVLLFATGAIALFVPSSNTIAAMYILPAIVNNDHIQNSTGNALEALENLTKEWLNDTVKNNKSSHKEEHI
jgi:hypothetical protein